MSDDSSFSATLDGKTSGPTLDKTLDGKTSGPALDKTLDGKSDPAILNEDALGQTFAGAEISLKIAANSGDTFPVSDWDRYEFIKLLGRGGMGAVFKARDRKLSRLVALKFIHSVNPETTARFIREARAQARIDHKNVCKVYEVGEVAGKAYIAMQLVDGLSLAQAALTLTVPEKVQIIQTVAEAIHEAHRLGIIHRGLPYRFFRREIFEKLGLRNGCGRRRGKPCSQSRPHFVR